jgi:chitin disaccharide deacetylase
LWGFDVSHLDAHMGTMQIKSEFFDVYLDLAVEFGLPLRLSGPETESLIGFPFRALAADAEVVFPDEFVYIPGVGSREILLEAIPRIGAGVTEAYLHPAVASPELQAMATDWENRVDDHRLLVTDRELRDAVAEAGITLIGYRELRDLMRSAVSKPSVPR